MGTGFLIDDKAYSFYDQITIQEAVVSESNTRRQRTANSPVPIPHTGIAQDRASGLERKGGGRKMRLYASGRMETAPL